MYEYTVLGKGNINFPFDVAENTISDTKTQIADYTKRVLTLKNGLELELHQYPGKIIVKSNRELIFNGNDTLTVPL
jgi:hypothetical protein